MKIVRNEFILLMVSMALSACSPQSSTEPAPTTASETTDSTVHSPPAEHGGGPVHWSYGEDDGPTRWAALSSDYGTCASGREQSPIDIVAIATGDLVPSGKKNYQAATLKIIRQEHVSDVIDNGHTIQINYDEGSNLQLGDVSYELKQYHFHAPSEHTIEGRHFPMEMHLVHQNAAGELAVLGVLIEQGDHNLAFEPVWANLPDEAGEEVHIQHLAVNVDDLLPANHDTYRYRGSLTTPPCSEGVSWLLAVEPITLSADQIAAFTAIFQGNNRPVQPLNDRTVFVDRVNE